jgi:type IV pilus assembly protein PilV
VALGNAQLAHQRGTSLIEVLISLLIVAFGLLGLAGLQGRLQTSEVEAYQRSQAILLLDDMASRLTTNRANAVAYITAAPLGAGMTCPVLGANPTRQEIDAAEWCVALQGAAESASGVNAGAMIGGRGCVQSLPDDEYLITVAWQGLAPVSAPPEGVACGRDLYDDAGDGPCTDDRCRRVVTTVVRIGSLD